MNSQHPALRLTPSNSPFLKSPIPRSPTKTGKFEEPGLHLNKVIGTTTSTSHGFDALPGAGKFAYIAGAAAVVATVHDDLTVTQRFYRANPSAPSGGRDGAYPGGFPLSPTPNETRHRNVGGLREHTHTGSPLGSVARDWADSPGKTTSAKDRVKAATSVALSPNGKWLAVGETGYKPRILIFSLLDGSSDSPVAVMVEHTFGVHALRFSPDSRSLASLGTVNDGFIYVWNVEERTGSATLVCSNKCTTLVHAMTWMGRSIVTVGLRFVKVWRPDEDITGSEGRSTEASKAAPLASSRHSRLSDFGNSILSPKHRALSGKNSLLGELLEATFTCAIALSDCKAIVCAESGEVCLLDDRDKLQALNLAVHAGTCITAARLAENDVLHALGTSGDASTFLVPDLERRIVNSTTARRPSSSPTKPQSVRGPFTVVTATVGQAVVEINSNRVIRLLTSADGSPDGPTASMRQLTAHEGAVQGVQHICSPELPRAAFLTFSSEGSVHFWDEEGNSVHAGLTAPIPDAPEMYGVPNELKAVAVLPDGLGIASGDKYGTIALMDHKSKAVLHQVRAHSAEVLDLLAFRRMGVEYLISASRDRTVQLFRCQDWTLELLQTMDEHAGAVTGLLLAQEGNQLLSCSADRSIVVRECISREQDSAGNLAFAMLRAITLKSAPSSMCLAQNDGIWVSTVDRCVGKFSTKSSQPGFSFKCSDNEGGEAVVLSKILYAPSLNGNPTIAGISSSDKSVRLYSDYGSLIARDWGHTEGVTDIAFVPGPAAKDDCPLAAPRIATAAADSTIFLWNSLVSIAPPEKVPPSPEGEVRNAPVSTPLAPPLRKVISHSEMSRLRRDRMSEESGSMTPNATSNANSTVATSPHRMRKQTSRMSLAQTPRLDPIHASNFDPSRRRSLVRRSPSPPSPRNTGKKEHNRRPGLGMSLKSKSSENVLTTRNSAQANGAGFGSITSSTESVSRTLRAYRKRLANSASNENITPDAFRDLEKELKLTARLVGEKSQSKNLDEAMMSKLLDEASSKIVGLLDEKLKARIDEDMRRNSDVSTAAGGQALEPPAELDEHAGGGATRPDTAPSASQTADHKS